MAPIPINPEALRRRRAVQRARMAPPSRDRFAAEAAAEARAQPLIYEPDNGQTVRVEYLPVTVARQPSARVTEAGNKLQHAAELLGDVLAGEKDIHEAAAEYGEPRRGGRARQFPRFADYLRDRIAYAEHPDRDRELLALMTRGDDVAPATPQARKVQTDRLEKLLDNTGRDYADSLRALARELAGAPTLFPTHRPRGGQPAIERTPPMPRIRPIATVTRPSLDRLREAMNVYVTLDLLSERAPGELGAMADDAATDAHRAVMEAMQAAGIDPDTREADLLYVTLRAERRYGRPIPVGRIELVPARLR
jgi:hypothetical protein